MVYFSNSTKFSNKVFVAFFERLENSQQKSLKNWLRIDREIDEKHALQVIVRSSIITRALNHDLASDATYYIFNRITLIYI